MITGKTVVVGEKSFDAMTHELRELHVQTTYPKAEPGCFTVSQYGMATGANRNEADAAVRKLLATGKIRAVGKMMRVDASGRNTAVKHYRVK